MAALDALAALQATEDDASIDAEPGVVVHARSGRRLGYGEIAAFAQVPDRAPEIRPDQLKKTSEFRLIGKDVMRIDVPGKVNGSAAFGTLTAGSGNMSFQSGALGFAGDLDIDSGKLFGNTLTLNPDRSLAISGKLTIFPASTFTLNGGEFSCGEFTFSVPNNGTFNFNSGTLGITGSVSLASSNIGNTQILPAGKNLYVGNTTTIPFGSSITINGGNFYTSYLTKSGGAFTFSRPGVPWAVT